MGQYLTLVVTNCRTVDDLLKTENAHEVGRIEFTSDDRFFCKFDSSGIGILPDDDVHVSTAHYFYKRLVISRLFLIKDDKCDPESLPVLGLCFTDAEDLKLIEMPKRMTNDWDAFQAFLEPLPDVCPVILWWR